MALNRSLTRSRSRAILAWSPAYRLMNVPGEKPRLLPALFNVFLLVRSSCLSFTSIRLSEKFLSFYEEIIDAQCFFFYITLSNYVRSILFCWDKHRDISRTCFHVCMKLHCFKKTRLRKKDNLIVCIELRIDVYFRDRIQRRIVRLRIFLQNHITYIYSYCTFILVKNKRFVINNS